LKENYTNNTILSFGQITMPQNTKQKPGLKYKPGSNHFVLIEAGPKIQAGSSTDLHASM